MFVGRSRCLYRGAAADASKASIGGKSSKGVALAASLLLFVGRAHAQNPSINPLPQQAMAPDQSTETVLKITGKKKLVAEPKSKASETVVPYQPIQNADPSLTVSDVIARNVPGASINDDNGLRIRGADDQFSTYIDGVPIPLSITGSLTDTLDPKEIKGLRVYTGGFPAQFGGQLAGVFDITTFTGSGAPSGSVSQSYASFNTYDTLGNVSGGTGKLDYFASASELQTGFFITPPTQNVQHDNGHEDHGFLNVDLATGGANTLSLQLGGNGSGFEIPDTSDTQQETGNIANLSFTHTDGRAISRIALYTRHSSLRYNGSPNDALLEDGILETNENQNTTYVGVRADGAKSLGSQHLLGAGFGVEKADSEQDFVVDVPLANLPLVEVLRDDSNPHAWDVGLYVQDDWTPGNFDINYGVRYDQDSQSVTTNQVSPRFNAHYALTKSDSLHAYYDRLFQPIPVEDAVQLVGQSSVGDNGTLENLKPERDDFYEVGYDHTTPTFSAGIAAYYKTGKDVRDDDQVGDTNITLPVNDAKAYFRGVEFTLNRKFSSEVQGFANLALSWNRDAGPVTGGLNEGPLPTTYFYDDHDQTYTSSFGLSYSRANFFTDFDGEYGSGQPYGEIDDADGNAVAVNYLRVPPHVILDLDAGDHLSRNFTLSFFADNLLNHGYIIKEVTDLSNTEWAQGRVIGTKMEVGF